MDAENRAALESMDDRTRAFTLGLMLHSANETLSTYEFLYNASERRNKELEAELAAAHERLDAIEGRFDAILGRSRARVDSW